MVWEAVEGVGSAVDEEVEGAGSPVAEEVEGVGPSVGGWLSSSNFSFSLFMYVLCDFLPRSCLLGPFVTFFDALMFCFFQAMSAANVTISGGTDYNVR